MSDMITPGAADPAAGGGGAAAPWYEGKATPEMIGFWENRSLHDKDPVTVAIEATKAAQHAQQFVGTPPDQLLRLPKDASDEAGWSAVWQRLGAPADATGYDFAGVKKADGTDIDPSLADFWRTTAASLKLPKDTATALARQFVARQEAADAAAAAERAAKMQEENAALQKNWGANHAANMLTARQAAAALGVTPDQIAALEGVVGYAKVMNMFQAIGEKIGEDKFVTGSNPQSNGVMTREQAMEQKRVLMADSAWVQKYLAGDAAAFREMTSLNTMIDGTGTE